MSKQSFSIQFSKKQVEYIMHKTGDADPDAAIQTFMVIISEERIDPTKVHIYVKKLMDKDGVK